MPSVGRRGGAPTLLPSPDHTPGLVTGACVASSGVAGRTTLRGDRKQGAGDKLSDVYPKSYQQWEACSLKPGAVTCGVGGCLLSVTLKGSCGTGMRTGSSCQFCGPCSHKDSTRWTGEPLLTPPLYSHLARRGAQPQLTPPAFPTVPHSAPPRPCPSLNGDSHQEEAENIISPGS